MCKKFSSSIRNRLTAMLLFLSKNFNIIMLLYFAMYVRFEYGCEKAQFSLRLSLYHNADFIPISAFERSGSGRSFEVH